MDGLVDERVWSSKDSMIHSYVHGMYPSTLSSRGDSNDGQ